MVTRLGGYEMIPGFLKDISLYPYSRVFGRNVLSAFESGADLVCNCSVDVVSSAHLRVLLI
jgi:hypothetical protein